MPTHTREAKLFAALFFSMMAGAILLMALGNNAPPAGAFCLNSYYALKPIEQVIGLQIPHHIGRWDGIEIYYSGTCRGNVEQLALLKGLTNPADADFHFCICNGRGGGDGQIQSTERWKRQLGNTYSAKTQDRLPETGRTRSRTGSNNRTIRICVIADNHISVTDYQLMRLNALVDGLCRTFDISPQAVRYPPDWR